MTGLHDANLRKAHDDLGELRQALGLLQITDLGSADPVDTILSWIDWDQAKPWDSANHVGREAWPKSGVGEMHAAIEGLTRQRSTLAVAWKGAAADVFQEFSRNVLDNCRKVVTELEAMEKVMSSGHGTTHEEMTELTKSVWKHAGDIADDPKMTGAVRTVFDTGADAKERSDARLEILGGLERLKKSVITEVDRIDDTVVPLVKPFAEPLDLPNPLPSAPAGPPRPLGIDSRMMMSGCDQMRPHIAGLKRAKIAMELAWHAIDTYSFGTSAHAQQVVTLWRQALTHRAKEIAECYGEAKGMYAGAKAVFWNTMSTDNWAQDKLDKKFNAEMERQRLNDYWHRNASNLDADGVPPTYFEQTYVEADLDALDSGWSGIGKQPQGPPGKAGPEEASELGKNIGEGLGKGLGRGLGRSGE